MSDQKEYLKELMRDLGFSEDSRKNKEDDWKKRDHLIHRVFAQNEAGVELLSIWKESLIMTPVVVEGLGIEHAGIREGMNQFIRGIITTINRVERGE